MTILVTASSGQLGRLVVDALLARGVAASDIVAGARTPSKVADLAARGIRTTALDYNDRDTIAAALEGIDSVLLISGSEPGNRVEGHLNVIAAAEAAGVAKLVYTSAPQAAEFDWPLGVDHAATEKALADSTVPHVIVRNNWYIENAVDDVLRAGETGVIAAAVGDAKVARTTRQDFAEGAAVVLIEDGHLGRVYEFGADTATTHLDLAAAASDVLGRPVTYLPLTSDELLAGLAAAGLDDATAGFVASIDSGIAGGVLDVADGTLSRLIGRPTTSLVEGLRAAVAAARVSA